MDTEKQILEKLNDEVYGWVNEDGFVYTMGRDKINFDFFQLMSDLLKEHLDYNKYFYMFLSEKRFKEFKELMIDFVKEWSTMSIENRDEFLDRNLLLFSGITFKAVEKSKDDASLLVPITGIDIKRCVLITD